MQQSAPKIPEGMQAGRAQGRRFEQEIVCARLKNTYLGANDACARQRDRSH